MEKLKKEELTDILLKMCTARAFEEKVKEMFLKGKINGTIHLSIGEEASAIGAISALKKNDIITSNHKRQSHSIAKGSNPKRMMAELLGKKTGLCEKVRKIVNK